MISVRFPPMPETYHKLFPYCGQPRNIPTRLCLTLGLIARSRCVSGHVVRARKERTRQGPYHCDNRDVMSEYKGAFSFPHHLAVLSSKLEALKYENLKIKIRFYEPARLSTPLKHLFSLKPLDVNLVEVIVIKGPP